jgi:hypothetical protein
VPDTPHDHGVFAELVGLPLAKPMFSRYIRMAEELELSDDQMAQIRAVQRDFYEEMTARHAEIINLKNELRQLIVDFTDAQADLWTPIHELVDRLYEAARSLDHSYYTQMERGYRVLEGEQSRRLMDAYEREELDRMPTFQAPVRRRTSE